MNGIYYGNGWGYKPGINGHAATLYLCPDVPKEFDLNYKKVRCNIEVSQTATLTKLSISFAGDNFTINNAGTIQNSEFSLCSVTNTGTIKDSTFRETNVTNENSITGCFWLELYGDSTGTISNSGSITNSLFQVDPHKVGLDESTVVHTFRAIGTDSIWCDMPDNPCFARHSNESYTSSCFYTIGSFKIAVHYDDDYGPKYSYKITAINGIPAEKSGHGISYDGTAWYTLTVGNKDIVLSDAFDTSLEIVNGYPNTNNREPIYATDATDDTTIIGWKGNGWKYENGTLTLESGSYDFSTTKPTTQNGDVLKLVDCKVVVENGATITGGHFRAMSNYGTVKNSLLSNNDIINCGGTMTNCLFCRTKLPEGVTGYHKLTEVNNNVFDVTLPNAPYIFSGYETYYFTGTPTLVVCLAVYGGFNELHHINGDEHYGNLTGPDSYGYYTFTPPEEEDIVLNDTIIHEPFTMTNGYPTASNGGKTACKGEGWKYENDTLTLENGKYNFSKDGLGPLDPDVKLVVGPSVTLTGGVFNEIPDGLTTDNVQTISLNGSDSIVAVNGLSSAKWNTTLYAIKDSQVEITADTDITNINGWDIGKFPGGSSYPNGEDDKTTVSFRMPDGPVVLNDTLYTLDIIRGTMLGNTSVSAPAGTELILKADEPAKNETFLGWTLSDESLLTKGTLNDPDCKTITITMKNASATAEAVFQKDTPAYTLTVTGGGLVNDKTSAVVEAGDEVRLTVGEMQEGMSFNYWDLPTALIKALMDKDSNFSNKVEPLTFTMPNLSEYTEDKSFTIRLDIRPAELPDDDDGPSVLGTMATVAVGGAAAGILVWQGVSLGVDSYLQLSLPGGVPVPANRIELVKLLWETAGKPDVVLPALYGDVSAEDGELQKATRWAIDNGLVKSADESDASRFDPDRSVSKYEVARAWFKVQQMLK